jgi:hypothetical protein
MLQVDALFHYTGRSQEWSLKVMGTFVKKALVIPRLNLTGFDVGKYDIDMRRRRVIVLLRVYQVTALRGAFVSAQPSLAASDELAWELRYTDLQAFTMLIEHSEGM